jgi:serine phosphatase RsbU (regulator of sigma subunit)/ligand-binding sensor domain-containing protein
MQSKMNYSAPKSLLIDTTRRVNTKSLNRSIQNQRKKRQGEMHSIYRMIAVHGKYIYILLFLFSNLILPTLNSQTNQNGIPIIKHYSPENYKAHTQNWAIVKDKRGYMYFGNNFGVLQYTGTNWNLFQSIHSSAIRSLAVDKNGFVYYGSSQDFGVLIPDSVGNLTLFSLYQHYFKSKADFNDIWCIHVIGDEIYFQSNEKLFRLKMPISIGDNVVSKDKYSVISPSNAFHWSFGVYDKFYVREFEKGLFVMNGDKLELVPGGEIFANLRIYAMLPYIDGKIMVVTREKGLFIFNPKSNSNTIEEFKCQANKEIIESLVYGGASLPNGHFAVSTLNNGVFIINTKGQLIEHLNIQSGLPDQQIYAVFADKNSGNLWLTTSENGIFNAYTGSPFREWNKNNGLNGIAVDIVKFKNSIYIVTNNGLFVLDELSPGQSGFTAVEGLSGESWDLQIVSFENQNEQKLLVAATSGIYEVNGKVAKQILNTPNALQLKQSKKRKNQVYIGYLDGFGSIEFDNKNGKWNFNGKSNAILQTIRAIYETPDGQIFLGTQVSGFLKLKSHEDINPTLIDAGKGLPVTGSDFKLFEVDNELVFATQNGLFTFNETTEKVEPYLRFGKDLSNGSFGVYHIEPSSDGYWVSLYSNNLKTNTWQGIAKFKKKNGGFEKEETFSAIIPEKAALALFDDRQHLWVSNDKGLFKFDKQNKKNYNQEFFVNILKVTTTDDSLLFAGTYGREVDGTLMLSFEQPEELKPVLKYRNNQIRFEYSSGFYEKEENTLYSYRLIGLESRWSKWSVENKFPYTNLPPGKFRFEVRAQNIYGITSEPAYFEFTILPPWYRTILAYFLFVFILALFIWFIVKLNIKRLEREKVRLEGIVTERTTEIRLKNIKLEQQNEEILAQRDEIELQRDKVMLQKEQIEDQNKNITDSILYASKIQEAILPPEEILNELLPEYFILYRPRDIVSGDFYWTNKKDNKTILVAADCTGHGVPGAFMSMLGITYLNEITNKHEVLSASQILDELRTSVKRALRQTGKENEAKDGMDMALCVIDLQNMTMQYAGAYNSLILIRNNEMLKFEADRMPIGIYPKEKPRFTNYEIKLQKNDIFYLHSDGYIDQFGGKSGSKLMLKRFKDLLFENHKKPMDEQKIALNDYLDFWQSFTNHKGETYKQLDDILVIGIKI